MTEWSEAEREELLTDLEAGGNLFPGFELNRENGKLKLLGRGGFSAVYEMRGSAPDAGRTYALKVIGMERHTVSEEQFRETCRLQRKLSEQSPYIMRLLDTKELPYENGLFLQLILMERLEHILKKDKFQNVALLREDLKEESGVLQFALQIGQAIRTAHDNQVLHRDIKLENIFWNAEDQVYQLGDFGIARFVENGQAETVVYTDGYGAPEIERRLVDSYSAAADIYSFGITLYLLLNGLKFPASDRYRANPVQYDPEFVFPAPEKASPQMAGIIRKMCSFYPEDRYRSMGEVLAELRRLAEEGKHTAQIAPAAETEDKVTVTYRERTLYDRAVRAASGRMERLRRERARARLYRWMEAENTVLFALLFLLLMYGLQKEPEFLVDWRFWSFPVMVLIEAVLLKIKDFHVLFGTAALVTGVYSMMTTGITVIHIVLLMGLLSGIPAIAAAGAIAAIGWIFLRLAGGIPMMDFLTKDWILWIYPAILLSRMHAWAWTWLVLEHGENIDCIGWRGNVWEGVYYLLPFVSVAAGVVCWGVQKAGVLTVPEAISRLHPILSGVAFFVVQVIEGLGDQDVPLDAGRD